MTYRESIVGWLDAHPGSYFWLVASLLTAALLLAVMALFRPGEATNKRPDWTWGAVILLILAAGRWPTFLVSREFNPDETAHLAGAHALAHDPVFWRSVDGGTSGPLNYFALWPAGWLCGWDSYVTLRLTALVLLAICLVLLHQGMALLFGRGIARVAGLAAVGFEALTNSLNFLHYSTELLPMALLAGAFYAGVQRWSRNDSPLWNGLGGLLLGAVPLAKLQAAPLAFCLGLGWLLAEFRAKGTGAPRQRIHLVAGALLPAGLFAWQLTLAGLWPDFFFAYFLMNAQYAVTGSLALWPLLESFVANSVAEDSLLHLWLPGILLWLVLLGRIRRPRLQAADLLVWAALAACLISAGSIIAPHRPFLHYCQLLVLPGSLLLGAVLNQRLGPDAAPAWKYERWLAGAGVILLVGALLVQRGRQPNPFVGSLLHFVHHPRTELSNRVMAHAPPGSSIAIWGWSSYVYVETGLAPAVRDMIFVNMMPLSPNLEPYRARFLADLTRARPLLFVDSSGPSSLLYKSPALAHDRVFPQLAAVIRLHYLQIDEVDGARIYRLRDPSPR